MANVIIGIHGLGNKPPKKVLENWWKRALIEGLKTNNYNSELPEFELVYWADILYDKPLNEAEKDEDSPYFLKEVYVKAPKNFPVENHITRKKVIDFIGRQINNIFLNKDLSLNYAALTDAILRKYFNDLEVYFTENCTLENASICNAKDLINKRLIQTLNKYSEDEIMLVSHSMGSIIAFDVLNFELPHNKINSFVTMGSPLGLPVVISKIAAEQKQKQDGVNHMKTPPPVSKNWFNFSDILDKVAFNYRLDDDFSENSLGIQPIDFLVVNNYEIKGERNPHKIFGYLRTPEFAKVLNDFIITEKLSMKQKIIRKTKQIIHWLKTALSIY